MTSIFGSSSACAPAISRWLNLLCRLGLGGAFMVAGGIKLMDLEAFAATISQFDLAPEPLIPFVALGLPIAEILAGAGLIFRVRGSLTAIVVMLSVFIGVLWYGVLKDLHIDCGCFGPSELAVHDSLRQTMYRDIFMLGLAGIIVMTHRVSTGGRSRPSTSRLQ